MLVAGKPEDAELSVGAMLYSRRLLAGIDCHDMGRKIGLSGRQVLALESGDSRPFRSPDSCTRALRVYARKLDVGPITASAALAAPSLTPNSNPANSQRPALLIPPDSTGSGRSSVSAGTISKGSYPDGADITTRSDRRMDFDGA